jgi:hypothetical protein
MANKVFIYSCSSILDQFQIEHGRALPGHTSRRRDGGIAEIVLVDLLMQSDIRISWHESSLKNKQTAQGKEEKQILMSRVNFRRTTTSSMYHT